MVKSQDVTRSTQHAAIIVGHGSLLGGAGAGMMRIVAQLRQREIAPIIEGGFLNYSIPTVSEAVDCCLRQAATSIIIQPFFLIAGAYVSNDLDSMVKQIASRHPQIRFTIADVLGAHPAMVKLAIKRLAQVQDESSVGLSTRPEQRAVLFVAHGTPLESANLPIIQVMNQVRSQAGYAKGCVGYLDCNQPDIPAAFAQLADLGMKRIDVLPYFLHLGRHVRKDLPEHFEQARQRHPQIDIRVTYHLDDDPLLVQVCAERVMELQGAWGMGQGAGAELQGET